VTDVPGFVVNSIGNGEICREIPSVGAWARAVEKDKKGAKNTATTSNDAFLLTLMLPTFYLNN